MEVRPFERLTVNIGLVRARSKLINNLEAKRVARRRRPPHQDWCGGMEQEPADFRP
jgi:hypothetical protein